MALLKLFTDFSARKALHRKLQAEMSSMSDAELDDLNLSYAQVTEMARRQAFGS